MDLQNKTIIVTGAAQGLGKSMAEYLAQRGARIAALDLNESDVQEAVAPIESARGYQCNVADEQDVERVFAQIVSDFGAIHGLVNNAGILRDGLLIKPDGDTFKKLPLKQFQSVIDVNLTGVFLCGREAAMHMAQAGEGGVIVNISSVSRAGNYGQSNYSAAKAGVVAMTTTWAKELARYGIRTGAIAPGFIKTDMTAQMPAEILKKSEQMVPLKRMGRAEEIASAVTFIFENDYFTGRVIEVDGGIRI